MLPGYHTQNFVSEIYRVRESADPGALDAQFDWATSYQSSASGRQFTKGRVDIYLISVYMLSPVWEVFALWQNFWHNDSMSVVNSMYTLNGKKHPMQRNPSIASQIYLVTKDFKLSSLCTVNFDSVHICEVPASQSRNYEYEYDWQTDHLLWLALPAASLQIKVLFLVDIDVIISSRTTILRAHDNVQGKKINKF